MATGDFKDIADQNDGTCNQEKNFNEQSMPGPWSVIRHQGNEHGNQNRNRGRV